MNSKHQQIPKQILNRRHKKLRELIDADEYFSEECIRMRDPLLYFIYVGRYKRNGHIKGEEMQLAELLIDQVQRTEYELLLQREYEHMAPNHDNPEKQISPEDLEDNTDMLIRLMHQKFLHGQDAFDYENVDNNELYDDVIVQEMDQDEVYFDEMEAEEQICNDTGIEDY